MFTPQQINEKESAVKQIMDATEDVIVKKIIELGLDEARNSTKSRTQDLEHKTMPVKDFMGHDIDIDENIAPLISEIWKAQINTNNSCQDNVPADYVWVEFSSINDFDKFINIINNSLTERSTMYERMMGYDGPHWRYNSLMHDENEVYESDVDDIVAIGPPKFKVTISLRFPQCDLDEVYTRVRDYNRKHHE
jgi:hypothetical protein